jgi:hypothetical protein
MAKIIGRAIARTRAYYPVGPDAAHCDVLEAGQEFNVLEGHEGNWYDLIAAEKPKARKAKGDDQPTEDLA